MVACGPFTHKNNLLYEPLRDLFERVAQDKPQVLILMGPFVDANHEQVQDGILSYKDPNTKEIEFIDFQELFKLLFEFIHRQMEKAQTKTRLVVIPSAREMSLMSPLPLLPYEKSLFPKELNATLVGNPQIFSINDINIGVINADIVKDMCQSLVTKQTQEPKIEIGLKSIL